MDARWKCCLPSGYQLYGKDDWRLPPIYWLGKQTDTDLHLAVANDNDAYMGTVSLKHIHDGTAEFAITVRACAMGKGYSQFGMVSILEIGIFIN